MSKTMIPGILVLAASLALPWTMVSAQGPTPDKTDNNEEAAGPARGRRQKPGKHQMSNEDVLERLTKALDLKDEQRKKIEEILNQSQPETEKLQEEMKSLRERMKKAMFRVKESIRESLDMDQKEKFDKVAMPLMMTRGRKPAMGGSDACGAGMMCGSGMKEGPLPPERDMRREEHEGPPPQEGEGD